MIRRRGPVLLALLAVAGLSSCESSDDSAPTPVPSAPLSPLVLVEPNGGEVWTVGSTRRVAWSSRDPRGTVDIESSADGVAWTPLATSLVDDGSEDIVVPAGMVAEGVIVRIRKGSDADASDESLSVRPPFTALAASAGADFIHRLAWGDFDGDGDGDLALATERGCPVFRNDGGSWTEVSRPARFVPFEDVEWGDVDGDGDLDLAAAGYGYSSVFRFDGTGFDDGGSSIARYDNTFAIAWADIDLDGDLDLALAGAAYCVLFLNSQGRLVEAGPSILGAVVYSMAWADFDGDGDPDLAIGGPRGPAILRNDSGRFTHVAAIPSTARIHSVAWGDWDGDGDPDLILAGLLVGQIWRNDAGRFSEIPADLDFVETSDNQAVDAGDYDGDGDSDLLFAGLGHASLFRNDGALPRRVDATIGAGLSVAWGDLDGDGDLDVATGTQWGPRISRNEEAGFPGRR